uniref:Uncharacterized protein n=1 Tax=Arundo donax TaxID=35708 RepID=A0A0A8YBY3_ARUDO
MQTSKGESKQELCDDE